MNKKIYLAVHFRPVVPVIPEDLFLPIRTILKFERIPIRLLKFFGHTVCSLCIQSKIEKYIFLGFRSYLVVRPVRLLHRLVRHFLPVVPLVHIHLKTTANCRFLCIKFYLYV